MTAPKTVLCESHGLECYRAGSDGITWTCMACEVQRLEEKIDAVTRTMNARTEHLS